MAAPQVNQGPPHEDIIGEPFRAIVRQLNVVLQEIPSSHGRDDIK